jgi:hypothetical protein
MRYRDFIDQLSDLVRIGEQLREHGISHRDPEFRDWRHRSESLVAEAVALGWRLPGPYKSSVRAYAPLYATGDAKEIVAAFRQDVSDSLIELRHLVDQFERYGEPKSIQLVAHDKPPLPAPDKVTVDWLAKNVPVGLWAAAAGILAATFLLGASVGQTEEFQALWKWIKNVWSTNG